MKANTTRTGALVKVNGDSFGYLLLQIAQILPLGRDAAAVGVTQDAISQPDCWSRSTGRVISSMRLADIISYCHMPDARVPLSLA